MSFGLTHGIVPPQRELSAILGVPPLSHLPSSPSRFEDQFTTFGTEGSPVGIRASQGVLELLAADYTRIVRILVALV